MKTINARGVTSILVLVILAAAFIGTVLTGYTSIGSSLFKAVKNTNMGGERFADPYNNRI